MFQHSAQRGVETPSHSSAIAFTINQHLLTSRNSYHGIGRCQAPVTHIISSPYSLGSLSPMLDQAAWLSIRIPDMAESPSRQHILKRRLISRSPIKLRAERQYGIFFWTAAGRSPLQFRFFSPFWISFFFFLRFDTSWLVVILRRLLMVSFNTTNPIVRLFPTKLFFSSLTDHTQLFNSSFLFLSSSGFALANGSPTVCSAPASLGKL